MPKSIPNNSLVVVADGHRAILFRASGSGDDLSLREERRISPKDLLDDGPSGSRPEEQTPKQTDEATFAKQLVQNLNHLCLTGTVANLIIIADPQTLGQMRPVMHKSLEKALLVSVSKDLTNHSAEDIADSIRRVLAA